MASVVYDNLEIVAKTNMVDYPEIEHLFFLQISDFCDIEKNYNVQDCSSIVPQYILNVFDIYQREQDKKRAENFKQFAIDFPREKIWINKKMCTNMWELFEVLISFTDDLTTRDQIIAFLQQASLFPVYKALVDLNPDYLVTECNVPEPAEIHITIGQCYQIKIKKNFQCRPMEDLEQIDQHTVQAKLHINSDKKALLRLAVLP